MPASDLAQGSNGHTNVTNGDREPEIIGYAEPWIVAPGDTVDIKVSCTEPEYEHQTFRLIQGVTLEHAPSKQEEQVTEIPPGRRDGRYQTARPGSYVMVPEWGAPWATTKVIQVSFWVQPWLNKCGHKQALVSNLNQNTYTGFAVVIDKEGLLNVRLGTGKQISTLSTGITLQQKVWTELQVRLEGQRVQVDALPVGFRNEPLLPAATFSHTIEADGQLVMNPGPLLIAATPTHNSYAGQQGSQQDATDFFNGRIGGFAIRAGALHADTLLVKYDFSLNMSDDVAADISGHGHNGILINAPTRAVTGHDWDGSEPDWTRAKTGYGAIHFHEDDMDDAKWATDFSITIPPNARSGAYALKVETTNGRDSDYITFFVTRPQAPHRTSEDRSKQVCFIFSTLTYLAYANERLYDTTRPNTATIGPSFDINKALKSPEFYKMQRRLDLGLSCYDRHIDGSGVCYSSYKRPILNVRPGYIMWGFSRPREFSADLMMLGYLEHLNIPYEILTDHDLHHHGVSAISGFNTVITGSHPEYPSFASMAAYDAFARQGGNLMYLGGNGFYWLSALGGPTNAHRFEVRRGDVGVRPYTLPGGERVNSLDGRQGGLWRSRGKSCNTLFGVGFCGEGTGPGVPYRRTKASRSPEFAWMFEGITDDIIGVHGFGGGASGDEIDRYDVENGSPASATVLATSTGHSDEFGIAIEDLGFPAIKTLGTQTDLIRSDVVYYVGRGGGGVFSVGSINWFCSLGWDGYQTEVARLTGNVVRGFLEGKR
ncbi:N,N-dimethylformamidase beta subunit [Cyphellophora attinorum]|uniref:N,N-dimethylformamidase beta subunit n=1 Tax=Cyphellophora attinorum TaxID=1664694 RepID=A0A0N1NYD6_9EURO|nr:N,N-dimethylformamidase beta subunit [Phialophora attinorum]KPI36812.1 N,N-dimethylformamidase beta subunit [Phialophora attinorum]